MADLTLDKSLIGANRQKAQIELNFLETANSTAYEVVPSLKMLDPYVPNTSIKREALFLGATGTNARDQVTSRLAEGPQGFQTTAPLNNATIAKMLAKASPADVYNGQLLARYTDGLGNIRQGQALLVYKGEVGANVEDVTTYAFSLEWITTTPTYAPVVP